MSDALEQASLFAMEPPDPRRVQQRQRVAAARGVQKPEQEKVYADAPMGPEERLPLRFAEPRCYCGAALNIVGCENREGLPYLMIKCSKPFSQHRHAPVPVTGIHRALKHR